MGFPPQETGAGRAGTTSPPSGASRPLAFRRCANLIVVQFPPPGKEPGPRRRTGTEEVIGLRRLRLWKVFVFGLAIGLFIAVVQRATAEFHAIRALLFQ
mgnify:CR=1 FL=1